MLKFGIMPNPVTIVDGVEGKICKDCLDWKPLVKFCRHRDCTGGRRNQCTTCEGRWQYTRHRQKCIEAVRRYQKNHPEAYKLRKRAAEKKRHGKIITGRVTAAEYRRVIEHYGHKCFYCKTEIADTMDHIVPLCRGGKHSPDNLVPACKSCNSAKGSLTADEWSIKCPVL